MAETLASFPNRGRAAAATQARELVHGRYAIRYRVAVDVVLVIRVRHTAMRT
jgi:plasmid stabilization system protein ParE